MVFCASVPHHITALFMPIIKEDPIYSGSIGIGIAIEPRLKLCIGEEILNNYENLPYTAKEVLNKLKINGNLNLNMPLPVKMGYATSASSTIATELIGFLYGKISYLKALQEAHKIEIENKTGLGDVLAISCGIGIVLRKREGAPGIGEVDCISFPKDISIVTLEFGSMETKELLNNYDPQILNESQIALNKIEEDFSFETVLYEIKAFTEKTKIINMLNNKTDKILKTPGLISYYVKKKMVVLLIENNKIEDALYNLKGIGLNLRILRPSSHGPEAWQE